MPRTVILPLSDRYSMLVSLYIMLGNSSPDVFLVGKISSLRDR